MNTKTVFWLIIALLFCSCSHPRVKQNSALKIFTLQNEPTIGKTPSGDPVLLGGFSGLQILGRTGDTFDLLTLTDRGPNGPLTQKNRPFLIPDYAPRLVKLRLNVTTGELRIVEQIPFRQSNGENFSGLPPKKNAETPLDLFNHRLTPDPDGLDTESLCIAKDHTIWVGDEYGPDILHFQADGRLLKRLRPEHELPKWLRERPINRGFEGLACFGDHVYAILQSPLKISSTQNDLTVRLLDYDVRQNKVVGVYVYLLDSPKHLIGDLHALGDNQFLVIEQNGKTGTDAVHNLYRFDISKTHNWLTQKQNPEHEPIDRLRAMALNKSLVLDLKKAGYDVEKVEGLAVNGHDVILVSDNDFGVTGDVDFKTGHISLAGKKTIFAWFPDILK